MTYIRHIMLIAIFGTMALLLVLLILLFLLPIILIGKAFEFVRNGVAWFSEKVLKKPFGLGRLNHSLAKRQRLCPHLNGLKLTKYEQNEPFLWAKCNRNADDTLADTALTLLIEVLQALNLCQNINVGEKKARVILGEMPGIQMQTDFIDNIYALESECFKTSEALRALAKSLQGFGFDTKELCEYSVSASKYDIDYDLGVSKEIQLMKEHLQGVREMLMFIKKTAWLDGLAQRHNTFDKLSKEDKESISALFDEAKQIHRLITSDFVDGVFWISAEESIRRATKMADSDENERARIIKMADSDENEWVVPSDCFGIPRFIKRKKYFAPKDEAQNAIKAEFSSNADENKPNDKA